MHLFNYIQETAKQLSLLTLLWQPNHNEGELLRKSRACSIFLNKKKIFRWMLPLVCLPLYMESVRSENTSLQGGRVRCRFWDRMLLQLAVPLRSSASVPMTSAWYHRAPQWRCLEDAHLPGKQIYTRYRTFKIVLVILSHLPLTRVIIRSNKSNYQEIKF